MAFQCSKYLDLEKVGSDDEKKKCSILLDLLNPIMKSYPSEMAIHSISQGLQIFADQGFVMITPSNNTTGTAEFIPSTRNHRYSWHRPAWS